MPPQYIFQIENLSKSIAKRDIQSLTAASVGPHPAALLPLGGGDEAPVVEMGRAEP